MKFVAKYFGFTITHHIPLMHPGLPFILEDDSSSIGSLVVEEFQRLATEVSWHFFKTFEYMWTDSVCISEKAEHVINSFRIVLHKMHDDLQKCAYISIKRNGESVGLLKKPRKPSGRLRIEAETALKEIKGAWVFVGN